jgi:hypothetical protein
MRITTCLLLALTACATESDDDGGPSGSNELVFHGEQAVLPGFSKDTGMQPADSPVQIQLTFNAGGSITADAQAIAGGSGDAVTVVGTPGSGMFKLDAHMKAAAMLHVALPGLTYDGPVPGIENIDIQFAAERAFDPFLLGNKAELSAAIPEIKLPPIPLPGGLPGTLNITIADGSVIRSALTGSCAGIDGKSVQFLASTSTGGTLVVKSEIVISVPIAGDKTFTIPSLSIDIPAIDAAMDMGTKTFTGGGSAPQGASTATKGACGSGPGPGPGPDPTTGSAHVVIDGQTVNVDSVELWDAASFGGDENVFINLSGSGLGEGSDFSISASDKTSGCVIGGNMPAFRPTPGPQYLPPYDSTGQAVIRDCGLTITAVSSEGGRNIGSFRGVLDSINVSPILTKQFEVTWDIPASTP